MLQSFRWRMILTCLLAFAGAQTALQGQASKATSAQSATLTGRVLDSSQAVIPGARVLGVPGNTVVMSNEQGAFLVSGLGAGSYTITISAPNFTQLVKTVNLAAGQAASIEAPRPKTTRPC